MDFGVKLYSRCILVYIAWNLLISIDWCLLPTTSLVDGWMIYFQKKQLTCTTIPTRTHALLKKNIFWFYSLHIFVFALTLAFLLYPNIKTIQRSNVFQFCIFLGLHRQHQVHSTIFKSFYLYRFFRHMIPHTSTYRPRFLCYLQVEY